MKRFIALSGIILVAGVVVAGIRELRTARAEVAAVVACAAEIDALARLRESQRLATADLVDRLVNGSMSLTEVVDALEEGTRGQPVLLDQLALNRDEATTRERLAGYARDRANAGRGEDDYLAAINVVKRASNQWPGQAANQCCQGQAARD